ncbi:hypothetical protein ACN0IV_14665 [Trabulsiella odontotermitis]|uniref:hypothetical protein n=1 Tax=Trabulsiella odontotermitis TaxID=379893 RepID=UPI003ACAF958
MEQQNESHTGMEKWDSLIHSNFQRGMLDSMSQATIEATYVIDKFSMWLLVGTGATASIIIANLDKIIPYIGKGGFKLAVILLALSSLCGVVAKIYSIGVEGAAKLSLRAVELMKVKQQEYDEACQKRDDIAEKTGYESKFEPNFKKIVDGYVGLFPSKFLRSYLHKVLKHADEPNEGGNKKAVHSIVYQSIAVFTQSVLYVAFLVVVAFSVSMN